VALLKIAKLGNPILRKIAEPVLISECQHILFQQLIDDMVETMRALDGVGLAAPQVFASQQVIVVESNPNARYPNAPSLPLFVMLNPAFVFMSEDQIQGWEGCLSLDNLRGRVVRSARVAVKGFNRYMEPVELEAEGFLSVVIQHEMDHLVGKVFIDRMKELTTLTHLAEYDQYWLPRPVSVARDQIYPQSFSKETPCV